MASSKTLLLLLCALFALVLLISSEVAASKDQTHESMTTKGVEEALYGGPGNGDPGYGRGGDPGYGRGGGGGGGGYQGGGGCRQHGCCRRYRYGSGCQRCCSYANEVPDADFEDDIKN
ncbi:unnamed protein product [Ilex paraguariensis]|uniref:Glycine-rich protein n=1 Tax=Ilex paraguariensis TaxID=185542 RepID=A0ABC8QRH0_9AQUA